MINTSWKSLPNGRGCQVYRIILSTKRHVSLKPIFFFMRFIINHCSIMSFISSNICCSLWLSRKSIIFQLQTRATCCSLEGREVDICSQLRGINHLFLISLTSSIYTKHLIAKSSGWIVSHKLGWNQISAAIVGQKAMKFVKFSSCIPCFISAN